MNRPTTRRRSQKHGFEDDDAPAPKRAKMDAPVNGAAKRTNGATKKSAKVAYEEEDDGFQFTRRATRRTAAKAQPANESIPEDEPVKAAPAARRKKPAVAAPEPEPTAAQKRRRSARLSGDNEQLDSRGAAAKPLPKRTKKGEAVEKKQTTPAPDTKARSASHGVQTPKNELHVSKKRDGVATTIKLPFADTPVITRNKEMRKASKDGHRRSSTGLRGRRASSLIDSGQSNALPHSEVEVRDFYKYIEQSLPEPRRMKQLLTWCGSRALPEKPQGRVKDANAIMAARAIQQELIDDFASKPELSDWFSREDTAPKTVVKKPNPINEKNQATLEELEAEVQRLEEEKAAWEALASNSDPTALAIPTAPTTEPPTLSSIDTSLLDPSQASIIAALQLQDPDATTPHPPASAFTFRFTTPAALESHLSTLSSNLEPQIDLLADGLHKIEQYRITAERVADRVLGTAATRLEERNRETKERVQSQGIGVGDVLRGLAGVLHE